MEMQDIIKNAGALIAGAADPVKAVSGATEQIFKFINHITEDDPVKQAKVQREYTLLLLNIAKEVRNAEDGSDITNLFSSLTELLNNK